jgi:hypothetical protein
MLTGYSENITITNNIWSNIYIFTGNWSFTFKFEDSVWNTWEDTATVTWIDKIIPTASITYDPNNPEWHETVTGTVTATLTWYSENITITNNWWSDQYIFSNNWSFTFEFENNIWLTWEETATVTWIDKTNPTTEINYSATRLTNKDITATLTGYSESITITNNWWSNQYAFTWNWSFTFEFEDNVWNTWENTATVTWIDKTLLTWSISIRVNQSSDDAEEKLDSSMYLYSSDLELVEDGSIQKVGMRFQNILIPQW